MQFYNPPVTQVFDKTADYILNEGDNRNIVTFNTALPVTCSIPKGLQVGFICTVVQVGAGLVNFTAPGIGNDINAGSTTAKQTKGNWSWAKIICIADGKYTIEYGGGSGVGEIILLSQYGHKFKLTVDEESDGLGGGSGEGNLKITYIP
jgi:hypothetical protein